jgi:uncharacterized membrane-anchored protein YitT (DUF2179 family)
MTVETKIRDLFSKRALGRTLLAVLGTLLYAIGINLFVVPVGVYAGGIMGICQLIRTLLERYLHLNFGGYDIAGIIYYIVNIPLFFVAYRFMGRLFFIKTMICMAAMTFFLTAIPIPSQLLIKNDVLTSCIIGGIIAGAGTGLTLINGGSGGGMDVIGLYYIKRKKSSGVGRVSLAVNAVLYAVCFWLFDISTTIYSIIVAVIDSFTIDRLHSQNINVQVMIISKKDTGALQSEFMKQTGRGITKWRTTGAYTNEGSEILFIILSKYEVTPLRQMVHQYDPDAFIVVNEGVRVDGNYLKKL